MDIGYQPCQDGGGIHRIHSFACIDIGIDCTFETQAATDQELMRRFIDHAESAHHMQVLSADVIFKLQNAIKK
jgi:predicted small metal-binding protein